MFWFAYPLVLIGGTIIMVLFLLAERRWRRDVILEWPYAGIVRRRTETQAASWTPMRIARICRLFAIILALSATGRPQYVDEKSRLPVEGRDIMLVLDVSGSMQLFDDKNDRATRFDAAKREVLRFIEKRVDDQIGLVLFAATAFSRCPLTYDKKLLATLVSDIKLGLINPDGTVLSAALAVAINRLRSSTAQTKIVIVLTDGAPSEYDLKPDEVIALARQCGIKVYAIGVGSEEGGLAEVPLYGLVRCQTPLNVPLLERYARETGGAFFRAARTDDIASVYRTIDNLEKSSYVIPRYARYGELFPWFACLALLALCGECFLRLWWILV